MTDAAGGATIAVEIVYADPQKQIFRKVEIAANATVAEAFAASGIASELPPGFQPAAFGIFGRLVTAQTRLAHGDRVELYRPLTADPKEARRRRAGR